MKFGIHSLLFSETFTERDLPLLDKAKAMGFDAVDIVPFDIDNFPAKLVRRRAADLGLDIIIEIGMPAHANIISSDPAIRAAGTELTKRFVDLSVEAGSQLFGGVNYCCWGYLTGRMRTEEGFPAAAKCHGPTFSGPLQTLITRAASRSSPLIPIWNVSPSYVASGANLPILPNNSQRKDCAS